MRNYNDLFIEPNLATSISVAQAWYYRIIPVESKSNTLLVLCDNDFVESGLRNELAIILGKSIDIEIVQSEQIDFLLQKFYRKNRDRASVILENDQKEDFLESLIKDAKFLGSSDIHIESYEEKARIRIRIDGHLVERYKVELSDYASLINKIKIRANLDISEKRLPQDGRILARNGADKIDIRVSSLPAMFGEKLVLRLLNSDASGINIDDLGLSEIDFGNYQNAVRKPNGIILISGPTGSGKTTTLYATLKLLNQESRNILTIEDPIEYTLEGVNQVQLKESIGLTFSSALRTFLRQDPDVIMLGEIRDSETAQMAIRASLTGHLVLSTIHTNSALGIIHRLQDMGIPSYLLASTLNLAVAQRLVRLLCPVCKRKTNEMSDFPIGYLPPKELEYIYKATGCDSCHYTGYKGRKALYEIIPINSTVLEKLNLSPAQTEIELRKLGVTFLTDKAFDCIRNGDTSVEEVYSLLLKF